ncbi:LacI family DNA-binding transcriptional regulator [Diaphorobacter aerolatus]|uniref:LacI family DNA-binding transcriptional regulator n=1 Tax=Diaphorobacter aerolatus TaxID=1288495 RepID=A0A7H0GNF6_9BURK|nr:LacI family DNA-binding transcriptional regulator [Diaphorobacter aerolatus]QNP49822.1 LacI family DNA-binding transcriptional regulator [Diaphorobacter aerolatus]
MRIQDVAKAAGVSIATVSRALNALDKVTPETRERVRQVAAELGYTPNASARTLRTQRSCVIGVVLPTLLNPVFAECLEGIAATSAAAGYSIQPFTTEYQVEREDQAVKRLLAANVDGIILVVSNPGRSSALQRLIAVRLPYVLAYNQHARHPCVGVNNEKAVRELIAHLTALGHERIAMVSGMLKASDRARQRYRGYRNGMKRAGLAELPLIEVPFVETAVQEVVTQLVDARLRPTALVCSNDLIAIRCLRAAHLAGLSVPHQISITGFDGIALGEDLTPMLGTIAQPNADIGRHSVELLVQAIAAGKPPAAPASIKLAHHFRAGESCAPAPRTSLSTHPSPLTRRLRSLR